MPNKKIVIGKYHLFVGIFSIYCFASAIWSYYPEMAIVKGNTIFQILICFSILYHFYYYTSNSVEKLLKTIIYVSIIVGLYIFYSKGIKITWDTLIAGRRLEVDFANINSVAGIAAVGVIIMFYYIMYKKKYIYIFLVIFNTLIIAASGSKKGLFAPIIGCFLVIIIKNLKKKKLVIGCFKIIFGGILFYLIMKTVLMFPVFNMINTRIDRMMGVFIENHKVDNSTLLRKKMILLGIEQFSKTPFLGIGIGNSGPIILEEIGYSHSYLHNNFIELLACGGIVGFLIYYSIYFYFFYKFFKKINYSSSTLKLCLVLCFCMIILDFGQVSYYSKITYFYFMIFSLELSKTKKKKSTIRRETKQKTISLK